MDVRERILESALKLFVSQGLTATTSSITKDAGVSTGILFHYFPTKNDLIIALYDEFLEDYLKCAMRAAKLKTDGPEKYIANLKQQWTDVVDWGLNNWQKYQYLQLVDGSAVADQVNIAGSDMFKTVYEKANEGMFLGIQYGLFRALPIELITKNAVAVTQSITEYLHEHPECREDSEFMERAWEAYVATSVR